MPDRARPATIRRRGPRVSLIAATASDAAAIVELRSAAASALTAKFGRGHWSGASSVRGILYALRISRVYVARRRGNLIATLQLQTRKPWAIDTSYFTPRRKPLYLVGMAVEPAHQGSGVGRACLEAAVRIAREWPADAIRLDAYDADAGAGAFYAKCGFTEMGRVAYRGVPLNYFELLV